MRIIFFWLAVLIYSVTSQTCDMPHIERTHSQIYGYRSYVCDTLTLDIECIYSSIGVYEDPSNLCTGDHIRLHLSSTIISILPGSSFKTNFNISELYLEDLGITKITPGAFNHQSLIKNIFLSKNNLSFIGDGIFNSLTNLELLDLSENKISNISEDAFSSVPLKSLNVSFNNISSIPGSFANMNILDLSHNFIKSIPSRMFAATSLNISSNELNEIHLSYFPNIKILYIADNAIGNIDFQNTHTLQELDLHNNKVKTLPEDLKKLVVLNVGGNKISDLPNRALLGNDLRVLILSHNSISSIPVEYFGKLRNLEVLDLSKNSLSKLSFGTFDALQSLNTLNISYNNFKILPIYTFHSLKGLNNLYFSNNGLTDINVDDLLKHMPNLRMVDIQGNTITCHNLVEVCHNLQKHNVSFEHGSFTGGNNIHGMICNGDYDLIDIKEKSKTPEINEGYATLLNYFNKEFRNSNFVQYLEKLRTSDNKTEDSNLLRNLTDILADTKQLINEITKTDKAQTNILEKLLNTISQTTKEDVILPQASTDYSNISESILQTLNQIVNYTKILSMNHDKEAKELHSLGFDIKQELSGIGKSMKHVIELEMNSHTNQLSHDFEQQQTKSEVAELRSFRENATSEGSTPVLTFIAVLLTMMVCLMLVLVYVIFARARHVISSNSDVELARLVESKIDTVNN